MPLFIILVGIILIVFNYIALKKDKGSFSNVYDSKKEDLSEVDLKIAQMRKDIAESLLDIQQEILELKNMNKIDDNQSVIEHSKDKGVKNNKNEMKYLLNTENSIINDIHFNSKAEQIKRLLDMGLDENQICEKLSLGKGEVQLVKGLFKKQKN